MTTGTAESPAMLGHLPLKTRGESIDLAKQLRQGDVLRIREAGENDFEANDWMLILTGLSTPAHSADPQYEFLSMVLFTRRGYRQFGTDVAHGMRWGTVSRRLTVGGPFVLYNRVPTVEDRFSASNAPFYTIPSVKWAQIDW